MASTSLYRYTNAQRYIYQKMPKKGQVNGRTYLSIVARIMCFQPPGHFPRNSLVSLVKLRVTAHQGSRRPHLGSCSSEVYEGLVLVLLFLTSSSGSHLSSATLVPSAAAVELILIALLFLSETNYNISPFPFPSKSSHTSLPTLLQIISIKKVGILQ